ncbi:MAG: DMT family transporter [Oscillospiraceae bacterium]|nr:DMT family transporter [Oscillospiraceae bacterium]
MSKSTSAKLSLLLGVFLFGTLGGFSRFVTLPTTVTTMIRGFVAAPFLLLIVRLRGKRLDTEAIKKNLIPLVLGGLLLAAAMITLFEAYKCMSVAAATMFYNLAPIIYVALSPILFKEKLTGKKIFCILMAFMGVVLVSNLIETGLPTSLEEAKGIIFGLACAVSYSALTVINKKVKGVPAFDKTIVQIAVLGIALLPVNLISGSLKGLTFEPLSTVMLLVICIFHTGIAYLCYFGSLEHIPANTAALLTYIDPMTAVLMSAFILHEPMTLLNVLGVVMILGAALISEMPMKKK